MGIFFREIRIFGFFTYKNIYYQKINQFKARNLHSREIEFFGPRTDVFKISVSYDHQKRDSLLRFNTHTKRYFIGIL